MELTKNDLDKLEQIIAGVVDHLDKACNAMSEHHSNMVKLDPWTAGHIRDTLIRLIDETENFAKHIEGIINESKPATGNQ